MDLSIIEVDQKKSDAEIVHVRLSAEFCAYRDHDLEVVKKLDAITATIERLDKTHSDYVDRLSTWRDKVLDALLHCE